MGPIGREEPGTSTLHLGVWEDRDGTTSSNIWGISLTYTAAVTKEMIEFNLVINFKGVVQLLVLCGGPALGSWWGQSWGYGGSRAWVTVESCLGSWAAVRVLRSVLDTNSGLSQDPQTQDRCLWPLLGAHGAAVGLPVPPKVIAHTRAPWGVRGTPGWRLAPSHCHPPWEPGGCSSRQEHMPLIYPQPR